MARRGPSENRVEVNYREDDGREMVGNVFNIIGEIRELVGSTNSRVDDIAAELGRLRVQVREGNVKIQQLTARIDFLVQENAGLRQMMANMQVTHKREMEALRLELTAYKNAQQSIPKYLWDKFNGLTKVEKVLVVTSLAVIAGLIGYCLWVALPLILPKVIAFVTSTSATLAKNVIQWANWVAHTPAFKKFVEAMTNGVILTCVLLASMIYNIWRDCNNDNDNTEMPPPAEFFQHATFVVL